MCESNVYILRNGKEELVMERVDRIIPSLDNQLYMENVFGERKVVQARIKEMELVHHRIILDELREQPAVKEAEIWLEPQTDHGHFHAGEEVVLRVLKGYNMKPDIHGVHRAKAVIATEQGQRELEIHAHHGSAEINLGQEADGLIQVYVYEAGEKELYGKIALEIGHHHHHGLPALGIPLEIVPCGYSHARMGENYEIMVIKDGEPLPGAEIMATFASTHHQDYPHRLVADEDGKARLFLSSRGNYLFKVQQENVISTFTLVKSF